MPYRAPIKLQPTRIDLAVAKACARNVNPAVEQTVQVITWLADEKIMLAAVAAFWSYARLTGHRSEIAHDADRMLCGVALAGVLPKIFKRLVDRQRPDRSVVHGRRHGIPRSGNARD